MGAGLLIGIWIARHLGPEVFGLFNYAVAIVALFTTIATLGLNNIVIRDLVRSPENNNATLGTAFILQVTGGIIAIAISIITVLFFIQTKMRQKSSLPSFPWD